MRNKLMIGLCVMASLLVALPAFGRRLNDKLENRPYADLRPWHLGFGFGFHVDDIRFTHNGFITDDGYQWRADQANYQPGFSVNGVLEFRLNTYFSLRFTPGMYFGSRDLTFRDWNSGAQERQNLKTSYVVLPVDIKYAAQRVRNARPYIVGGIMPAFDVSKKRTDFIKTSSGDFFVSIGFGCDFYLPYFKLIPELKFCFGLSNVLTSDRPDLADDPTRFAITQSLSKATSKMVVLTFYFE